MLQTGEWWLAYQPIVDTATQTISSVEALLRWTHPQRGPVAPFDLIRVAERSGTIVRLGREILCRACTDACDRGCIPMGKLRRATPLVALPPIGASHLICDKPEESR